MSRMYNLIEALSSDGKTSKEQAIKYAQVLDMFRCDSNEVLNSISRLMIVSADNFESSDAVLRDMGELLLMLSELNDLCEERERHYREVAAQEETKQGVAL